LILSGLFDFSTDLVCDRLNRVGVPLLRLNWEDLCDWRFALDPVAVRLSAAGQGGEWTVVGESLHAVWFRQPVFLRNHSASALTPDEQLARSQWSAFLRALTIFDRAKWVNHPSATYLAESKPYQLHLAAELGFQVPDTVVTNDLDAVQEADLGNPLVLKAIETVLLRDQEQNVFPYASVISLTDVLASGFAAVPVTFQRLLQPKLDLRVTVIGDFVHCVRIVEGGAGIDGDWRLRPRGAVTFEPYPLHNDMRVRCIALTRRMGLAFGAIDLAQTSAGVYFLEINPTGEWGWLNDEESELDVEICQLLAGENLR
jgi:glutathione synthase/RimK-type ligase-like ATP-grasp enzyme